MQLLTEIIIIIKIKKTNIKRDFKIEGGIL